LTPAMEVGWVRVSPIFDPAAASAAKAVVAIRAMSMKAVNFKVSLNIILSCITLNCTGAG
jgi:hypothetical protein